MFSVNYFLLFILSHIVPTIVQAVEIETPCKYSLKNKVINNIHDKEKYREFRSTGELDELSQMSDLSNISEYFEEEDIVEDLDRIFERSFSGTETDGKYGFKSILNDEDDTISFWMRTNSKSDKIGEEMFKDMMDHYKNKGLEVKGITSSWSNLEEGSSKNFEEYKNNLKTSKSKADAARNTFTGRMASKYGFNTVMIEEETEDFVNILFTNNKIELDKILEKKEDDSIIDFQIDLKF